MKLDNKKAFAARALGVGEGRIIFNNLRLADIKEALTRQDIIELAQDGAIIIREIKGRRKIERRQTRKRAGSIRRPKKKGKTHYVKLTRKLRAYIQELRGHESITEVQYQKLRKEIKAKIFKDKVHLKERLSNFAKQDKDKLMSGVANKSNFTKQDKNKSLSEDANKAQFKTK